MAKTFDHLFKFVLIGDSGTGGKTCLLIRYVEGSFGSTISTIGIDFRIKTITLNGKKIKLLIWDTPGQERFPTITATYYRAAMGFIIGYDITSLASFVNIRNWMAKVEKNAPSDVQCLLIGNKSDLEDRREVQTEMGAQLADELGIPFLETSAKTGHNVTEAFELLARLLLMRRSPRYHVLGEGLSVKPYDHLFKVMLLGDNGVGKTDVLCKYTNITYTTSDIDIMSKSIDLKGMKIELMIWENNKDLPAMYYQVSMGTILVYDITSRKSFESITKWLQSVKKHASSDVQCLLIGNKSDMEDQREVPTEKGAQLADVLGIPFLETSAKTNRNVTEAFELLTRLVLMRRSPGYHVLGEGLSVKPYDHLVKVMFLGDHGVGKTDVLCKYTDKRDIIHTRGIDIMKKSIDLKGMKIELMIWENSEDLSPKDYQLSMGIIVVYDITCRKSFENITKWLQSVKKHASSDVQCLLIGNKSDLEEQRKVSRKEGIELARQHGISFLETSAKTNCNIDKAFEQLVKPILVKKMSESEHLKVFKTTLEEKGSLEQTIIHCLFFGHPRGGKSSLIKRLTGHPRTRNTPSTGVVEKVEVCTSTAMSFHSQWSALTLDDEAIALITMASQTFLIEKGLARASLEHGHTDPDATPPIDGEAKFVTLPANVEATLSTSRATPESNEATSATDDDATPIASSSNLVVVDTSSQLPVDYVPPIEVLKKVIMQKGLKGVEQYLQGSLTLYLTDTGGQMEFQELLPALVAGPSVFFVVFRLDQDLNKTFTVEYLHPDGQSTEPYQSSFSVKETLLQSLASIASMGTYVYSKKLKKQVPLKPKVVLVGTHKDKVSRRKIAQINRELQKLVEATSLYHDGLIEPASESRLVVTVDNLSRKDSDFQVIRSVVERIAKRGDFKVSSPSTWLIFTLLIRQQKKRVITYGECFGIAQKCGIDSRDELNEALWFLNTKVGLVRHFRGEGLEELEEIVIIDPQILFDKITKLIVETFTFQKVTADVHKEFKRKGIFPLSVLEQLYCSDDEDQLLTVSRLVKLLEHLHIIARLHSDTEEVKYFMPCTLAHAGSTAPVLDQPFSLLTFFKKLVSQEQGSQQNEAKLVPVPSTVPPLLVTFKCGYCPKGLFSALSVYLLANKMKSRLNWELQTDQIFKNAISLSVGPFATMTLSLTPTYMEVSVVPVSKKQDRVFPIEKTCLEVRQCIETAVREVTSSLNYTWDAEHALAFYCPGDHEGLKDKHPAIVQYYNDKPINIRCELTQDKLSYDLPKGHEDWFHEHSVVGEESCDTYQCPETNLEDVDDTQLDSQYLLEITDYIQGLEKTELYNLGMVLGLRRHRITDLRERCSCLEFCDSIVDCWLQRVDDVEATNMVPSWRNLVLALRHFRVGQTGLADRIAKERPVPV